MRPEMIAIASGCCMAEPSPILEHLSEIISEKRTESDFFGIVHEGSQRVAKTLGELLGALSDEIAKEVDFEA